MRSASRRFDLGAAGRPVAAYKSRLESPAERRRDRERHVRFLAHQAQEARAIEAQQLAVGLGADGGGSRAVGEERHLAHRSARAEHRDPALAGIGASGHVDPHLAARDQIEGVAGIALVKQLGPARQFDRDEMRGELGQGNAAEARKEIDPRKQSRMSGD